MSSLSLSYLYFVTISSRSPSFYLLEAFAIEVCAHSRAFAGIAACGTFSTAQYDLEQMLQHTRIEIRRAIVPSARGKGKGKQKGKGKC